MLAVFAFAASFGRVEFFAQQVLNLVRCGHQFIFFKIIPRREHFISLSALDRSFLLTVDKLSDIRLDFTLKF